MARGRSPEAATARLAGWVPPGGRTEHVGFGSVLGADGKMLRTRSGESVKLDTLLDEAEENAAPDIAMAAVKYADSKGVLLVHAAGNDGENLAETPRPNVKHFVSPQRRRPPTTWTSSKRFPRAGPSEAR